MNADPAGNGERMPPFKAIHVLYPRGLRTGGPEALHQLVHTLRGLGQEAYLTPLPRTAGTPRVTEYAHYDAPERPFEDAAEVALLAPETNVADMRPARKATRICWWLSIDSSPFFFARRERVYRHSYSPADRLTHAAFMGLSVVHRLGTHRRSWLGMLHLAQSHYAWHYLYSHLDLTPSLVTDYTPTAELDDIPRNPVTERGRTVAYNPRKGGWVVDELRRRGTPYDFVPIQNMSRAEALRTLCESAVYLDAGHHPGKDRMPREAALAGALTLVGRRGSGANSLDVPLPWEHKFDMTGDVAAHAAARLDEVFSDLGGHKERQSAYEPFVRGEQERFRREVAAFFVEGKYGSDLPGDRPAQPCV
jgi:hypothetical protein